MSTYVIKWLKDKLGTRFFPVTHINAVRDDTGTSLASMLEAKQDTLVSGTNIKTVNNNSLVGSGNVSIATGDTNVIETVKVNNSALTPDANKTVNITAVTTFNGSSGAVTYNAPVSSVNGQTGVVSIATGDTNVIETIKVNNTALTPDASKAVNISAVTSFNGSTGAVTYTAPVTSVNGQTGTVTLSIPSEVTESTVSGWGFTKNAGTITGITMNGASKGTSGVVNLGTVITSHQDISGKADKSTTTTAGTYKSVTVNSSGIVTGGSNPTTIAGYGITDAYTKTESDSRYYALYGGTNLDPSSSNIVDLNTLNTTGSYYCTFDWTSAYVTHKPIENELGFRLWVSSTIGTYNNYLRQRFQARNQMEVYERVASVSSGTVSPSDWGDWYLVQSNIGNYLPLSGGTLTGSLTVNSPFVCRSAQFKGTDPALGALDQGTISFRGCTDNNLSSYGCFIWTDWSFGSTKFQGGYSNGTTTALPLVFQPLGGNVGIGTSSPSQKLHVNGIVKCTSVDTSSDERMKNKVGDITIKVEDIANAPNVTFKWKEGEDTKNIHGGTYAQYWEKITPYYVHGDEEKSMDYASLSLSCAIELAKEVVQLKEENAQLKREIAEIKEILKMVL